MLHTEDLPTVDELIVACNEVSRVYLTEGVTAAFAYSDKTQKRYLQIVTTMVVKACQEGYNSGYAAGRSQIDAQISKLIDLPNMADSEAVNEAGARG